MERRAWDTRSFGWRQGEHVTLLGHTGSGKTNLGLQLLPERAATLVIATKPRDPLISLMKRQGYHVSRTWPFRETAEFPRRRVVYWPPIENMTDLASQREGIRRCLHDVYRVGNWCVYIDEIGYVTRTLGLGGECVMLWNQGRSLGVSLVAATQRPAWVPLEAYSAATHLFLWRESDRRNLRRLAEIGGVNSDAVQRTVQRLKRYDVLYVNTRDGELFVTRPPKMGR